MTPERKKATQLIALALGSSSVEEARTAAMAAVRLIHAHRLLELFVGVDPGIGESRAGYYDTDMAAREYQAREYQARSSVHTSASRGQERTEHRRPAAGYGFPDDLGDEFMDMVAGVPTGTHARKRQQQQREAAKRAQDAFDGVAARRRREEEEKKRVVYEQAPHTAEPAIGVYDQHCVSCGETIMSKTPFWRVPTNGAFAAWCTKHAVKPAPPKPPTDLPVGGYWGNKRTSQTCCSCNGHIAVGDRHYRTNEGAWCSRHAQTPRVSYPPQFGSWHEVLSGQTFGMTCKCCGKKPREWIYASSEMFGVLWCLECQGLTEPPTSD